MLSKEILPIGSVVRLLDQPEYMYMITGYYVITNGDTLFDYCGVHYPLGEGKDSIIVSFNASNIEEVLFEGYSNDQTNELISDLEKATSRFTEQIKNGELLQEA